MWLSRRDREDPRGEGAAEVGTVTLGGDPAGVSLAGERRNVTVFGPGGYQWRPSVGQSVLVIKAGADGEELCIGGCRSDGQTGLAPGEIFLSGGGEQGAGIYLRNDGSVELSGKVLFNGVVVSQPEQEEDGT